MSNQKFDHQTLPTFFVFPERGENVMAVIVQVGR